MSDETTEAPTEEVKPTRPLPPGHHESIAIPVAFRDVLPWTKPGCKSCDGRGIVTFLVGKERKHSTKLCMCAVKRFRKAQDCTVISGQLFAVEPWVAVHPETVEEAVAALEKEQAALAEAKAAAAAQPDPTTSHEVTSEDTK